MIQEIYSFVQKMLQSNGAKAKQKVLKEYEDNQVVKEFVKYTHDPSLVYGIQLKKLEKALALPKKNDLEEISVLDVFKYLEHNNTGKLEDLQDVADFIRSVEEKYEDMLKKAFSKQLKLGVTANTINKIWGKDFIFQLKVMRSKSYEKEWHKLVGKEVIATIKLDGMRMIVIKKGSSITAYSRSAKKLMGYEHILEEMVNFPDGLYDGELIYNSSSDEKLKAVDIRQKTASIANTKEGNRDKLEYVLFDLAVDRTYKERRTILEKLVKNKKNIRIVPIVYEGDKFHEHKNALMEQALSSGEEGLMVALSSGKYQYKQTHILQKIKPSYSIDLRVKEVYNGLTLNTQNELGGVIVEYKGFPLKVGNGWNEKQRKYYFNNPEEIVGKIIEIEHSGESKNKQGGLSVNFPRFIQVREDKNEESYD